MAMNRQALTTAMRRVEGRIDALKDETLGITYDMSEEDFEALVLQRADDKFADPDNDKTLEKLIDGQEFYISTLVDTAIVLHDNAENLDVALDLMIEAEYKQEFTKVSSKSEMIHHLKAKLAA